MANLREQLLNIEKERKKVETLIKIEKLRKKLDERRNNNIVTSQTFELKELLLMPEQFQEILTRGHYYVYCYSCCKYYDDTYNYNHSYSDYYNYNTCDKCKYIEENKKLEEEIKNLEININ